MAFRSPPVEAVDYGFYVEAAARVSARKDIGHKVAVVLCHSSLPVDQHGRLPMDHNQFVLELEIDGQAEVDEASDESRAVALAFREEIKRIGRSVMN